LFQRRTPNDTTEDGAHFRAGAPRSRGLAPGPPPPRGLPGVGGASVGDAEDPDGDVLDLLGREGGARLPPERRGVTGGQSIKRWTVGSVFSDPTPPPRWEGER